MVCSASVYSFVSQALIKPESTLRPCAHGTTINKHVPSTSLGIPTLVHPTGTCPTPAMLALCLPSLHTTPQIQAIHLLHSTPRFPVIHRIGGITNSTDPAIYTMSVCPRSPLVLIFYQCYRSCLAACPHFTPRFLVHCLLS
jgi:hypothetical protein